jgi:hypothetical protein
LLPRLQFLAEDSLVHFTCCSHGQLQTESEWKDILEDNLLLGVAEAGHIFVEFIFRGDFSMTLVVIYDLVEQALAESVEVDVS